ncbi:unnamed protein product [Boreogadus saida]
MRYAVCQMFPGGVFGGKRGSQRRKSLSFSPWVKDSSPVGCGLKGSPRAPGASRIASLPLAVPTPSLSSAPNHVAFIKARVFETWFHNDKTPPGTCAGARVPASWRRPVGRQDGPVAPGHVEGRRIAPAPRNKVHRRTRPPPESTPPERGAKVTVGTTTEHAVRAPADGERRSYPRERVVALRDGRAVI